MFFYINKLNLCFEVNYICLRWVQSDNGVMFSPSCSKVSSILTRNFHARKRSCAICSRFVANADIQDGGVRDEGSQISHFKAGRTFGKRCTASTMAPEVSSVFSVCRNT